MTSLPLNPSMAEEALNAADAAIVEILKTLAKRTDLHIRVGWRDSSDVRGFTQIAERSYGVKSDWEFPFDEVTEDKTRKTAESGLTSRELHQMYPDFLDGDDGPYWGNAQRGNLIISCSGVEPEYDEAIANMLVGILWAIMQLHAKANS